ncbi:MAG: tRNA pseudouridine(13) synthase TruD [Proteobacteria bacterium]|nr:tRNA pseudouridine(13) synthase TruD [Pseudomonadota bacterium]
MTLAWPAVAGTPTAAALLRSSPDDFQVFEQLGFELSGEGEHVFLHLQKRELNSMELLQRIARLSGIPARDIGMSGLKDRNAICQQWFSVRMAGREEPNWLELEQASDVKVLQVGRHLRKLKRGVHKANRFMLRLRDLRGDRDDLAQRLLRVKDQGFPNYFGEQRFGRNGSSLAQARLWLDAGGRKISRTKRSLFLSAMRAFLFNSLLASRIEQGNWNRLLDGDVCALQGSRSLFGCELADEEIQARARCGDIHPALPLWGRGRQLASDDRAAQQAAVLANESLVPGGTEICAFLERMGLELSYRPARALLDDFSWQFCDDGGLQLDFTLGTGSYATSLLAELLQYTDNKGNSLDQ